MVSFRTTLVVLVGLVGAGLCKEDQTDGLVDGTSEGNPETLQPTSDPSTERQSITDSSIVSTIVSTTLDVSHDVIIKDDSKETTTAESPAGEGVETTTAAAGVEDDGNATSTIIPQRDPCEAEQCRNGGTCANDSPNSDSFRCLCPDGFAGLRCEVRDSCGSEGCESGACVVSQDGSRRYCICFHDQHWDQELRKCRAEEPPCFPNPCQNGGSCSAGQGTWRCSCPDGFAGRDCSVIDRCGSCGDGSCQLDEEGTTKRCVCPGDRYWDEETRDCEAKVPPCRPNPCENGGTCAPQSGDSYNCSCARGFSGPTCGVVEGCSGDADCGGHGECVLSRDGTARRCRCEDGYYLEERSQACRRAVKPCTPNPCLHDGACTAVSDSGYQCECSAGWRGPACEQRDPCEMDGGHVFCADAACVDDRSGLGTHLCRCPEGRSFDYARRMCSDIDWCALKQCPAGETCVAGKCECKDLWTWNNSTQACEPDACSSQPCPAAEMACEEGSDTNDYSCHCPKGFAFDGTQCKAALCSFPSLNRCDQLCEETGDGGIECSCAEGFGLQGDNRTCLQVANNTCTNHTCDVGSCVQENGLERCICPSGYVEIEERCLDACSAKRLPEGLCPGDHCESDERLGFRCSCGGKYVQAEDGVTCSVRNVCQKDGIGWKRCEARNGRCVPDWTREEGFKCVCPEGLVQAEDGHCADVCSLEDNQLACSGKGAVCDVDTAGGLRCKCPAYFQMNSRGLCSKAADASFLVRLPLDPSTYQKNRKQRSLDASLDYRKIQKDVTLAAQRLFFDFTEVNVLSCIPQMEIILCKVELQFSRQVFDFQLNRLQSEETCFGQEGSTTCLMPPSLVLVKDQIAKNVVIEATDPCDADIHDELCGPETTCDHPSGSRGFNCSCRAGFEERRKIYPFGDTSAVIEICRDIDECVESYPCPRHSECTNTIGSYACACQKGFRSDGKDECVEICNPSPCAHGNCLSQGDHAFECKCEAGYRGTFCDLEDKNFKSARTNTIVVGVVLGGALLIALIISFACYSRLKKKKEIDDSSVYYNSSEMTERRQVRGGVVNNAFQRE